MTYDTMYTTKNSTHFNAFHCIKFVLSNMHVEKKVKLVRGFLENFADIVIYVKFTVFFVGWRMFFFKFSDFYFAWIGFREHQFIFPRPQVTSNYLKANLSHFLKVNTFFSTHFPSHNLLIKRTLIPLFVKFFV